MMREDLRCERNIPSLYTLPLFLLPLRFPFSFCNNLAITDRRHQHLGPDKLEQRPAIPPDPLDLVHNFKQRFPH